MTKEHQKTRWREAAETSFFWWRIIATVALLAWGAWEHFVGDGIREGLRNFLGVTEIVDRLAYIEETMPAPAVVEWPDGASEQDRVCNSTSCNYRLVAARTEFGASCGPPAETAVYLRLGNGRPMRIGYKHWWTPLELGRSPEEFVVPLDIPATVPVGTYYWRSRIIYPDCRGPNEPIPRYSPWFPLTITE